MAEPIITPHFIEGALAGAQSYKHKSRQSDIRKFTSSKRLSVYDKFNTTFLGLKRQPNDCAMRVP